jgi:hypothetical protein
MSVPESGSRHRIRWRPPLSTPSQVEAARRCTRGVPCPTAGSTLYLKLLYPGPGRYVDWVAVGNQILGVACHFWEGRTHPCLGPEENCPGCAHHWQPVWKGFVAAQHYPSYRLRAAMITQAAYQHCPSLRMLDGQLRGTAWRVARMGEGKNAPMKVQQMSPSKALTLHEDVDLLSSLERLWHLQPGKLGRLLERQESGQPVAAPLPLAGSVEGPAHE